MLNTICRGCTVTAHFLCAFNAMRVLHDTIKVLTVIVNGLDDNHARQTSHASLWRKIQKFMRWNMLTYYLISRSMQINPKVLIACQVKLHSSKKKCIRRRRDKRSRFHAWVGLSTHSRARARFLYQKRYRTSQLRLFEAFWIRKYVILVVMVEDVDGQVKIVREKQISRYLNERTTSVVNIQFISILANIY